MGEAKRPDYIHRIRRLCPDLAITHVQEISDGFTCMVLVVNHERVFRFVTNQDQSWVAEGFPEQAEILRLLQDYVATPVPLYDVVSADCVSYRLLPGQGLHRLDLLRLPKSDQEAFAASLAGFLRDLRSIPVDVLQSHHIGKAWITRSPEEYRADYERLKRELFPYANPLVRRTIREHFEPVLDGTLDLSYEPSLVHGDLKPWHILTTPDPSHLSGVIDWDGAGVDDPAQDVGAILYSYGESFVRQMAKTTPEIASMIDRARFYAGRIEPLWVAAGIAERDPRWLAAGLGLARDISPIGAKLV
jgi:aminoglycoside 2''-phosphotransferase